MVHELVGILIMVVGFGLLIWWINHFVLANELREEWGEDAATVDWLRKHGYSEQEIEWTIKALKEISDDV